MTNIINDLRAAKLGTYEGDKKFVIILAKATIALVVLLTVVTIAFWLYLGAGQASGLTQDVQQLFDTVEKSSAAFGATIGIAAAIAGALVTIHLANLAFDIASRTTEIARNEQRRESEKYAREVKAELAKYQRKFSGIFDAINGLGRDLLFYSPNNALFQSWLILQGRKWESGQIWAEVSDQACIDFRRDASDILEILLDASKHALSPHHDYDEEATGKWRVSLLELAQSINSNINKSQTFRSLSEALGILQNISHLRSRILPVLKEFDAILQEVDELGFVSDALMSEEDGERNYQFMRSRVRAIVRLIDDDDKLFILAGAAQDWSELLSASMSFEYAFGQKDDSFDTLIALQAYSLFGASLPTSRESAISLANAGNVAVKMVAVASSIAKSREELMRIFPLDIDGEGSFMPRPLMSYSPSSELLNHIEWTNRIISKIQAAEVAVLNNFESESVDECNPYSDLEKLAQRRSENARHRMGMCAAQ